MIQQVNAAVSELQGAVLSRTLYPEGHPQVKGSLDRTLGLLDDLLETRPEVSVFALAERVIFERKVLPDSRRFVEGLFAVLRHWGIDQISFRRGLNRRELVELVEALSAYRKGGSDRLVDWPHLSFGYLDGAVNPRSEAEPLIPEEYVLELDESAGELSKVWAEVRGSLTLDANTLGGIAMLVSGLIARSASAVMPLAPVKRHDEYTFVHTLNVAILSVSLAESLGLERSVVHDINLAALLHDIGKQFIAPELLNKPGRYTDEERLIVEGHSENGAKVLLNTPGVPDMAVVVAFEHHIRADGGGYPRIPLGWQLNLASRIVQVADVFDALRTTRPYRGALPLPKIIDIMVSDVGTFFDADLLQVFLEKVVSRGVPDSSVIEDDVAGGPTS